MADDKEGNKSFELYQSYRESITSNENLDEPFWDESRSSLAPSETNSIDYAYNEYAPKSMDSLQYKVALEQSKDISKILDEEDEKTKKSSASLIWAAIIFLLLLAGVFAFLIINQNEERKRLSAKRRISRIIHNGNYIPLFLHAPGTSSSVIPLALSSCLGLTEASFEDIENVSCNHLHLVTM